MAEPAATITETEVTARLRKLGNGDPVRGFRLLCAMAMVCSACCQRWGADPDVRCGCLA